MVLCLILRTENYAHLHCLNLQLQHYNDGCFYFKSVNSFVLINLDFHGLIILTVNFLGYSWFFLVDIQSRNLLLSHSLTCLK